MAKNVAEFPHIGRIDGVGSGLPCFKGTGIRVEFVVGCFVAGDSIETLADEYGVTREAVVDAIRLVASTAYGRDGLRLAAERQMLTLIPECRRSDV